MFTIEDILHSEPAMGTPEHHWSDTERMGEEIAQLSAQIQVAEYRLLVLIREFDQAAGWASQGARSCAHWLTWRIGMDLGTAREKVRVARALESLPYISESFSRGEISYSKVRAVTRVATPENERQMLTIALGATASQVETIIRGWRKIDAQAEREHAEYQREHRGLSMHTDDDGMVVVKGRLSPEDGALLAKALEAANDVLYHADDEEATPSQRRADALKLVCDSALKAELDPGNAADRYQVVVHVDQAALGDPSQPGQSVLEGGTHVSAETSRRIACDASIVEMTHDPDGNVLDVGRKRRTPSTALRRALDARDPTCRWPGCQSRHVQAHHIQFWAEGGETNLSNLCNLCSYHHHLLHDGGFRIERQPDGALHVYNQHGLLIPDVPAPVKPPDGPLTDVELAGWEGKPKWGYAPVDLELALDSMYVSPS